MKTIFVLVFGLAAVAYPLSPCRNLIGHQIALLAETEADGDREDALEYLELLPLGVERMALKATVFEANPDYFFITGPYHASLTPKNNFHLAHLSAWKNTRIVLAQDRFSHRQENTTRKIAKRYLGEAEVEGYLQTANELARQTLIDATLVTFLNDVAIEMAKTPRGKKLTENRVMSATALTSGMSLDLFFGYDEERVPFLLVLTYIE